MHIDLSKFCLRTDLIIENTEAIHSRETIEGIEVTESVKDGNYVTKDCIDYIAPLIVGEVKIEYKDGVPVYLDR